MHEFEEAANNEQLSNELWAVMARLAAPQTVSTPWLPSQPSPGKVEPEEIADRKPYGGSREGPRTFKNQLGLVPTGRGRFSDE